MSKNGWMNETLTANWLTYVWGSLHFRRRLLAWDAYRCHLTDKMKGLCRKFKTDVAVIPGGCTGILQVQLLLVLSINYALISLLIFCFILEIYWCNTFWQHVQLLFF
jgi:hypothetical protein